MATMDMAGWNTNNTNTIWWPKTITPTTCDDDEDQEEVAASSSTSATAAVSDTTGHGGAYFFGGAPSSMRLLDVAATTRTTPSSSSMSRLRRYAAGAAAPPPLHDQNNNNNNDIINFSYSCSGETVAVATRDGGVSTFPENAAPTRGRDFSAGRGGGTAATKKGRCLIPPRDEANRQRQQRHVHFYEALAMIPDCDKEAYMEALDRAPRLIEKESSPDLFLRYDKDNAWDAAKRFCAYWSGRKQIFGSDRAFLPMNQTGSGALNDEDIRLLDTGSLVWLPKDNRGRSVLYWDRSKLLDPGMVQAARARLRGFFYMMCLAAQNDISQTDGVVFMAPVARPGRSGFDFQFPAAVVDLAMHALPCRVYSIHLLFLPSRAGGAQLMKSLLAIMVQMIGTYFGRQVKVHYGEREEALVGQLKDYGLLKKNLPTGVGGTWALAKRFESWQKRQVRLEEDQIFTPQQKLERKRKLNVIHSRQKRQRRRIELEVLKDQSTRLSQENEQLRLDNANLAKLLDAAAAEVKKYLETSYRMVQAEHRGGLVSVTACNAIGSIPRHNMMLDSLPPPPPPPPPVPALQLQQQLQQGTTAPTVEYPNNAATPLFVDDDTNVDNNATNPGGRQRQQRRQQQQQRFHRNNNATSHPSRRIGGGGCGGAEAVIADDEMLLCTTLQQKNSQTAANMTTLIPPRYPAAAPGDSGVVGVGVDDGAMIAAANSSAAITTTCTGGQQQVVMMPPSCWGNHNHQQHQQRDERQQMLRNYNKSNNKHNNNLSCDLPQRPFHAGAGGGAYDLQRHQQQQQGLRETQNLTATTTAMIHPPTPRRHPSLHQSWSSSSSQLPVSSSSSLLENSKTTPQQQLAQFNAGSTTKCVNSSYDAYLVDNDDSSGTLFFTNLYQ